LRLVPGDVLAAQLSEGQVTDEATIARLRAELGLDRPFLVQYATWVADLMHGDLGRSLVSGKPVADEVGVRLPVTLELGVISIVISTLVALPIGVIAAIRRNSRLDYVLRFVSIFFISVPNFWLATLVIVIPAMIWRYMPALTYAPFFDDPIANLKQFLPPGIVLGLAATGGTMRQTRSSLLDVLGEDYVRTAWAKGLRERAVIARHALKNSLIPVLTVWGVQFSIVIGGSVIVESIFGLPGMGQLAVSALNTRDYTTIQAVVLLTGLAVVLVNLTIDLLYLWLDPRIRYE
jgi:peptide/nickel transport system permease protein